MTHDPLFDPVHRHRRSRLIRLEVQRATHPGGTRLVREQRASARGVVLTILLAAVIVALALSQGGCGATASVAAKAGAALSKAGGCMATRAWEQCAPVARACLMAQAGQCLGLQKKTPWVQPQPVCKAPASQPSKP